VPWPGFLHGDGVEALVGGRLWVLRLLFGLPAGVEVGVPGLTATVAGGLGLDGGEWLDRAVAAASWTRWSPSAWPPSTRPRRTRRPACACCRGRRR
jgi:hypothetical protein